eukprot:s934_g28.t1
MNLGIFAPLMKALNLPQEDGHGDGSAIEFLRRDCELDGSHGGTPPADVFSRKSRSALALARGKSITGNLTGETSPDLPVAGYRLRYWSIMSPEDSRASADSFCLLVRYLQSHFDVGKACYQLKGEPEVLPDSWGPETSSAGSLRWEVVPCQDETGRGVDVIFAAFFEAVLKWLIPGNTYVFEVMAFNIAGEGDWSEASMPFLMPERPDGLGMEGEEEEVEATEPEADSRLKQMKGRPAHLSKSIDTIEIAWKAPCDRGCDIETYEFLISQDPKFPKNDTRRVARDAEGLGAM